MDKRDWKRFVAVIDAADENCGKPRSKEAVALMFEVLKGFDIDDVARAVHRLMLESPYRITPADISRIIGGTASDKSALAWQIFKFAICAHGSFDSVVFPDAAYHWAIGRMGGWERVAREYEQLTDKELGFRERDFRQLYECGLKVASFDAVPGKEQVPRHLQGECERNNLEMGIEVDHLSAPIVDVRSGYRLMPGTLEPVKIHQLEERTSEPLLTLPQAR